MSSLIAEPFYEGRDMLLIDHARDVIGLPMRGLLHSTHIGWTTDEAKAQAFLAIGGSATKVDAHSGRVIGWEVKCPVGAEMVKQAA